ncbi:sulfate transporter CysZ [Salinicola halophilus]|uniref:sulfate transporter CysZ n=1 Tax=Salinicola halophilus TaxID=184065 RepID=UPI000DA1B864|nr:sulfate transporter CysZ [Salinicola halophilus]
MIYSLQAIGRGTRLVLEPGLRRFVIGPVLVNLLLYVTTIYYLVQNFGGWLDYGMAQVPSWLDWLEWLIWPLLVIGLVLIVFFTFTLVSNLIAAPFYGFLAEKVETRLTGRPPADERGWIKTGVDALGRELVKLGYLLPRMALLFVLGFVPGLNVFTPFLWALFSAWMMAIQYLDYPMDNNAVGFGDMRRRLRSRWWPTLTYGGLMSLATWVPVLNLLLLPGGVAGGVMLWDRYYRDPETAANRKLEHGR